MRRTIQQRLSAKVLFGLLILLLFVSVTLCWQPALTPQSSSSFRTVSSHKLGRTAVVPRTASTRLGSWKDRDDDGSVDVISPNPWGKRLVQGFTTLALSSLLFLSSPVTANDRLPSGQRYWSTINEGPPEERVVANTALLDYAVGTINTMYYDLSGGAFFQPRDFYKAWKTYLKEGGNDKLQDRSGAVESLQWLVSQLNDPFSSYLTREQLRAELEPSNNGFLGLGVMVKSSSSSHGKTPESIFFGTDRGPVMAHMPTELVKKQNSNNNNNNHKLLNAVQVANLPVVTAVMPDSPAERAGLVVGDRILAVGEDRDMARAVEKYSRADNYFGHPDLLVAKPVYAGFEENHREVIVAYRPLRLRIPTLLTEATIFEGADGQVAGGNAVVHYELLERSIFMDDNDANMARTTSPVGYIRLTRFSKAATSGFLQAVEALEEAGATSYIIDLRNNYGGVIQEAMLTASSLLRDPHAVLCYTLNSRGGFTPHDVEEYVVDKRYPGYLLSKESKSVTLDQVKRETPEIFDNDGVHWDPPSSFASLREQRQRRGINPVSRTAALASGNKAAKNIVLLMNEGTASSAEVFASALHDNGRTVATIGSRTFGKGLIQHTFPLPDGGGLRLTVAEYLTPALQHVTFVGNARFDRVTGEWRAGGIPPDLVCPTRSGIPRNVAADFCVGEALDALDTADRAGTIMVNNNYNNDQNSPSNSEPTAGKL